MENNKNNSINNNKSSKKRFFIKKDKDFDDLLKVKEVFEDPDKFLLSDKKMIIGKINLIKNNSLSNIKRKSPLLSNSLPNNDELKESETKKKFMKSQSSNEVKKKKIKYRPKSSLLIKKSFFNGNSKLNTYLNNINNNTDSKYDGIHYQKKTLNEIIKIFEQSKIREDLSKDEGTNKLFPKNVEEDLKQSFYGQEIILKKKVNLKQQSELLSKLLSSRVKRNEKDLLFNKLEEFRLKKQLIDFIENSKTNRDRFGNYFWFSDLRRPKIQDHSRMNYFYSENRNKRPEKVFDIADKEMEFINEPNRLNDKNYEKLLKKFSLDKVQLSKLGLNLNKIPKMNQIDIIKGEKLIEREYRGVIEGNNKKKDRKIFKLYKDPLEQKYKNVKDFVCGENYKSYNKNLAFSICKRSYNNIEPNKQNRNKNGIYRSLSQIEKNKKKKFYLKKAKEIYLRENKKATIKIISSK